MKNRSRVLIVDDDPELLDLVETALTPFYDCKCVNTGEKALQALWSFGPDVLVLDLKLPGFQGDALLRLIRADPKVGALAILMMSADTSEKTLLQLFEKGADDMLAKPFSPLELTARVRALLRRSSAAPARSKFAAGPLELSLATHRVTVDGKEVALTPTEFSLLQLLMQQAGEVVSKSRMTEFLWGAGSEFDNRTLDTHLLNLRKKLGKAAGLIETVRNVGLRLKT